eukprot:2892002-Rhodomonas_salina.1
MMMMMMMTTTTTTTTTTMKMMMMIMMMMMLMMLMLACPRTAAYLFDHCGAGGNTGVSGQRIMVSSRPVTLNS